MYHLAFLFATKNVELSDDFLDVKCDTANRIPKYTTIKVKRIIGDIGSRD
jgi:hypothetical protein